MMYADVSPIEEPSTRITPRAVRAWQWSAAIGNLVYFAIPVLYVILTPLETRLNFFLSALFFLFAVGLWIAGTFWLPWLRWKRWRYSIDQNEIDLKRGILITRRTLIPLNRVQHVDTRQGPILRYYGLAAVTISTAATTHEIPALDEETADVVRDRISRFARLAVEDV